METTAVSVQRRCSRGLVGVAAVAAATVEQRVDVVSLPAIFTEDTDFDEHPEVAERDVLGIPELFEFALRDRRGPASDALEVLRDDLGSIPIIACVLRVAVLGEVRLDRLVCDELVKETLRVEPISVEPAAYPRAIRLADVVSLEELVDVFDFAEERLYPRVGRGDGEQFLVEVVREITEAHPGVVECHPAAFHFYTEAVEIVFVDEARDIA